MIVDFSEDALRRIFSALTISGLILVGAHAARGAQPEVPAASQPAQDLGATSAAPKFIMTLSACAKHKTSDGGDICVVLNNARLEARLHESASTSSYHEALYAPEVSAKTPEKSPAGEASPASAAQVSAEVKTSGTTQESQTSYREGFELTLKPLYESDSVLYAQYDIISEQVTGWEFTGKPGTGTARKPVVQRTHVFGTTKLAIGQSATLERNGYSFVLTYAQKGGAPFVGDL
jgi:hypothetical protein